MAIERISESDLEKLKSKKDPRQKFVLLTDAEGRGYVHMGEGEHGHIVGSFNSSKLGGREIEESGFQEKGGGHLEAWSGGGKIKLHFFGRSAVMGEFDHEILRKTLEEVLDKEKFDWIIGERLRILKKKD